MFHFLVTETRIDGPPGESKKAEAGVDEQDRGRKKESEKERYAYKKRAVEGGECQRRKDTLDRTQVLV